MFEDRLRWLNTTLLTSDVSASTKGFSTCSFDDHDGRLFVILPFLLLEKRKGAKLKETITEKNENTSCGDKLHCQTSFSINNLETETRASLLTPWRHGFYTKYFTADFFINTNVNVEWNLLDAYLLLCSLNFCVVKIDKSVNQRFFSLIRPQVQL